MKCPSQHGFTLLEVLVAFAILGISLGVLLQTFATGLRNTALAEEYTLATLHAESVLAMIGVEEPLQEGDLQGEIDDKFSWRASVYLFEDETSESESFSSQRSRRINATPYHVVAEVLWGNGNGDPRSVKLETLRLALDKP